ncbi:MAG: YHS domain-containing (seleno)protein [Pseudomonadota bacterium]
MTDLPRRVMLALTLAAMTAFGSAGALQADELKDPEIYADFEGKALKGYDTVAYHTERRAVKGSPEFAVEWKGAKWFFASAENRDLFTADPERWAPQFGGYCAWAIAKDRTAPINPEIFRIVDDKLYLNLNMKVHKEWLGKRSQFIAAANEKWPEVLVLSR